MSIHTPLRQSRPALAGVANRVGKYIAMVVGAWALLVLTYAIASYAVSGQVSGLRSDIAAVFAVAAAISTLGVVLGATAYDAAVSRVR